MIRSYVKGNYNYRTAPLLVLHNFLTATVEVLSSLGTATTH
jgi:hypothetical protein